MQPRVLSVGQCAFDGPRLVRMLREKFGAKVDTASTAKEATQAVAGGEYALVLVNRVLAFDHSADGVELVEVLVKQGVCPAVMLVSDQTEAQAEAERRGAVAGFGKSRLNAEETVELLRGFCGGRGTTA